MNILSLGPGKSFTQLVLLQMENFTALKTSILYACVMINDSSNNDTLLDQDLKSEFNLLGMDVGF